MGRPPCSARFAQAQPLPQIIIRDLLDRGSALDADVQITIVEIMLPPKGARTSWTGRKFIGDEVLRQWIDRFTPDMVRSGHIHNSPFYEDGSWIDRSAAYPHHARHRRHESSSKLHT